MLEPFLKWAGGKRWLVAKYASLFPKGYNRYIEPFLGSAAVYFYFLPKLGLLSDANADLIGAYRAIRLNAQSIHRHLHSLQKHHCATLYNRIRASTPRTSLERAARFLYLNRTCFNGIYRVNLQGRFNVPMGSRSTIEYPNGYLTRVSAALKHASLKVSDFEATLAQAREGDFIYVDPPYTVMHNSSNFIKYNSSLFSWTDQLRLATALKRADKKGALIMLSNANHDSVRTLYKGFGIHYRVSRWSRLAGKPEYRQVATELIITNYESHA